MALISISLNLSQTAAYSYTMRPWIPG